MFGWPPKTSPAITAARAVPAGGQVVNVVGMGVVTLTDEDEGVPGDPAPGAIGVAPVWLPPPVGVPPAAAGGLPDPQAASRRMRPQPRRENKMRFSRIVLIIDLSNINLWRW